MPGLEQVCDLLEAGPASPTRSAFSGSRSMTSRLGIRSAGSVDTNYLHPTEFAYYWIDISTSTDLGYPGGVCEYRLRLLNLVCGEFVGSQQAYRRVRAQTRRNRAGCMPMRADLDRFAPMRRFGALDGYGRGRSLRCGSSWNTSEELG
jgi:hypothetical protein